MEINRVDIMTKGLWLIMDYKEKDVSKYKDFDEIYLIPKYKQYTYKQRFLYYKKLEKAGYKPYIVINFNDAEKGLDEKRFIKEIKFFSNKKCRIMLDYIRYKSMKWYNPIRTDYIKKWVEYSKSKGVTVKLAVWKFPLCFLVGQDIFTLKKHSDELQFMIYGSKPHKRWKTLLLLFIHRLIFPNQGLAIPGWEISKKEYKSYKKLAGKRFSVFRWNTYKKLK